VSGTYIWRQPVKEASAKVIAEAEAKKGAGAHLKEDKGMANGAKDFTGSGYVASTLVCLICKGSEASDQLLIGRKFLQSSPLSKVGRCSSREGALTDRCWHIARRSQKQFRQVSLNLQLYYRVKLTCVVDHNVKTRENPNVHDGTWGGGVGVAEMRERKMEGRGLPSPQVSSHAVHLWLMALLS